MTTETAFPVEPLPVDDYWSEEAMERRRKLRESLFGSDDDDDDEEEDDEGQSDVDTEGANRKRTQEEGDGAPKMSDTLVTSKKSTPSATNTESIPLPEPETIAPPPKAIVKGKAPARKPGFMARSTVIDHSQEKEATEDTEAEASAPIDQPVDSSANSNSSAKVSKTTPTSTASTTSPTVSETGAPSERRKSVTFNPQTRVRLYEKGEVMPNAASTPSTPKVETTSRIELLPDDDKSLQELPVAKPATVKARDSGVFSGFKKGFFDSAKPAKPVKAATPTPVNPAPPSIPTPTTASAELTIVESPEYHQPLAPAHEKPVRAKKQSVFSQRKAEAQSRREQLMNFSSFDPMPPPRDTATPITPVGTGASSAVNPMKMSVVEKATVLATAPMFAKPASGPIPTAPSAQQFPPNIKKQTAVKEAVMERKPPVVASPTSGKSLRSTPLWPLT